MILKAASYERVSSDEQAREGFSLEVQGEKNVAHIKIQGWELCDRYIDAGKSAKNLKRPDMQRLLKDIDRGKINVVVVHKLDRLTRNVGDLHELLSLFEKKEIKLVSITENIDTSSAMGRMFVYMLGIFAQWYRENLSEEVVKGQKKRAENGLRNTAQRPYGYNVSSDDLSLAINEEEAAVVRRIFEQYIAGWGRVKIAKELNKDGIPANRGGDWHDSAIGHLVRNPTYIGAVHWKEKDADENDRVITHDSHEPIISIEMWDETRRIIDRRQEGSISSSSYDFPYATVVKCGECGKSYHGKMISRVNKRSNYNRPTYRCAGKYKRNECDSRHIAEDVMDELFINFLSAFDFETSQPERKLNEKDSAKEIKRLTKLIDESDTKRKNYARAMGNGKLDYDLFAELMDEELSKAKKWQDELSQLNQLVPTSSMTVRDVMRQINNIRENWESRDRMQRKFLLQQLFEVLVIKHDGEKWAITGYKLAE